MSDYSVKKGKEGEKRINKLLKKKFGTKNLIKNVTLPTSFGTTQIDHVLILKTGIFVIESKNMSGTIKGKKKKETWAQLFPDTSYSFRNPIFQNKGHISALMKILNLDSSYFNSLIVFDDKATLNCNSKKVIYSSEMINKIKTFKDNLFSKKEIKIIKNKINSVRFKRSKKTDKMHVKNIKNIVNNK